MSNVFVSEHPLVKDKLTRLRDVNTPPPVFRQLVRELSLLLCYEATLDIPISSVSVTTPMGEAGGSSVQKLIGFVPIMRAGMGMVDGMLELLPKSQIWHIGLYRNEETLRPVEYYNKLPDEPTIQICLVLDPMLATGGSAIATINIIKEWGVSRIKYVGLLGAPEGVEALSQAHPNVPIHLAEVDEKLNDIGFIVPGLGDAGDRMYGT